MVVRGARPPSEAALVRRVSRRSLRIGLALVVLAVAGFALAAVGTASGQGDDTLTTITTTGTVTTTATLTESSTTIVTATVTTVPVTTTAPAPTTSTTEPTTEPTTATTATTAATASSSSSTPWVWIIVGLVLAAALIGIGLWQRSRAGARAWHSKAQSLNRRCLVALDDVLAQGSLVTGKVEALTADARALEASAPDDASRASVGGVRSRLEDLVRALESDRTLRLSSPAASQEQLSYSTSLIRQQVEQLQGSLRQSSAGPAS
jgi:hypothetical protein